MSGAKTTETALVTGASSGIGEALALRFAKAGFKLVLVARSVEKLESLAERLRTAHGVEVSIAPADLTAAGTAENLVAALNAKGIIIDTLVNCAGILETGAFVQISPQRHRHLIDLNIAAMTEMLAYFLPPMLERGHGRILNIASTAALQPVPSIASYAASKAYVLSLTESLSEELAGSGVSVSALCPGLTATNMVRSAQMGNPRLAKIPEMFIGRADDVAEAGYRACMKGQVILVPGLVNKVNAWFSGIAPRGLVRWIAGKLGRLAIER